MPVARLPLGLWSPHNDLQSLQSLVSPAHAFCRLKDFRRVATRYDKLAINFLSAVVLAAIVAFWV